MPDIPLLGGLAKNADVTDLLAEVCARLADIGDSLGNLMPDTGGRLRVNAEIVAAHAVTLASLATVTTVTSLTNMTQIGGFAANQHVPVMTMLSEAGLRRNIVFS